MRISLRYAGLAVPTLAAMLALGARAEADPLKCQRTILKESAKFVQAKMKALGKCEESKLKGQLPPLTDCHSAASTAIAAAEAAMKDKVEGTCGGGDKDCSTTGDNDSLASIGWDIGTCPDFESLGCVNPINDCDDIGTCLACINEAAVDQAIALYYGALAPSTPGDDLNKCQITIGKEAETYLAKQSKALQKCQDQRIKGVHGDVCPNPAADPGTPSRKAFDAIDKAESKMWLKICKTCGGADRTCDGVGDFTAAQIGFSASCPAVMAPGGASCAGVVTTVANIFSCVDCVDDFKAFCMDRLQVPRSPAT